VLECSIAGRSKLVATFSRQDLNRAVAEVRDDLWHQIDRLITKESAHKR
jgi:hypothetical protein